MTQGLGFRVGTLSNKPKVVNNIGFYEGHITRLCSGNIRKAHVKGML